MFGEGQFRLEVTRIKGPSPRKGARCAIGAVNLSDLAADSLFVWFRRPLLSPWQRLHLASVRLVALLPRAVVSLLVDCHQAALWRISRGRREMRILIDCATFSESSRGKLLGISWRVPNLLSQSAAEAARHIEVADLSHEEEASTGIALPTNPRLVVLGRAFSGWASLASDLAKLHHLFGQPGEKMWALSKSFVRFSASC